MQNKSALSYRATLAAAFSNYLIQAITCIFPSLLFVHFREVYGITLTELSFLLTLTFGLQITGDLAAVPLIRRIGVRSGIVLANVLSGAGFLLLPLLLRAMGSFPALLIASVFYSSGASLIEVLISPIVEACPTRHPDRIMSLLHSCFSWGCCLVIGLSVLYFFLFGIENWPFLAVLWAATAAAEAVIFSRVPLGTLPGDQTGRRMKVSELLRHRTFLPLILLMISAGASELAVSQWASALTEQGLGIAKPWGDLYGPLGFAFLMGTGRVVYGRLGRKVSLTSYMILCAAFCLAGYGLLIFSPHPVPALIGCGLAGFGVGILWPGALSLSTRLVPFGGSLLFSLLACGGDIGCTVGPTLAGLVSDAAGGDLKRGVLAAVIFPLGCLLLTLFLQKKARESDPG